MSAYDAIVIGSGQAGNPLSQKLADRGWSVALIEQDHLGGTCINTGCTPTKTMIAWFSRRPERPSKMRYVPQSVWRPPSESDSTRPRPDWSVRRRPGRSSGRSPSTRRPSCGCSLSGTRI